MTYKFRHVYLGDKCTLLASTKYKPIVKTNVNKCIDDYYMNEKSIERAESRYQEYTINELLKKHKVDLLISGDLQNQILSSTLSSLVTSIPLLGIYSACATFIEGLIIGSFICEKSRKNIIVTTSSHNLVSEKQFRFPVEYGAVRKYVNTCTASGSASALITSKKSNIKIESATIGYVVQTNHKDTNDMGSSMAPSCALVLKKHLSEAKRKANYYDLILTGDLGIYGFKIMKEYFEVISDEKIENAIDSGSIFYEEKNDYAGSSGPVCLPLIFFDYILKQRKYKKILLIGTGSMHSVISSNQNIEIPSISHAISLEVKY